MSILAWNYRGLANPRAVRFLKELVQQLRPSLIFLSEIFVDKNKTAAVGKQLGFPNCWVVDTDRHGGGVALLWKGENAVQIKDSSENLIDVEVTVDQVGCWRYTGFYGYPERSKRRDSWNLLLDLSRRSNTPWCVLGDFNDLMYASEKLGGCAPPQNLLDGFSNTVEQCGLQDLGFSGNMFTCERRRGD